MKWHERFGFDGRLLGQERNPFLRLSVEERYRLGINMLQWIGGAAFFLWVLGLVGWLTT